MKNGNAYAGLGSRLARLGMAASVLLLIVSLGACKTKIETPVLIQGSDIGWQTNADGRVVLWITEDAFYKLTDWKLEQKK